MNQTPLVELCGRADLSSVLVEATTVLRFPFYVFRFTFSVLRFAFGVVVLNMFILGG